MNVEQLAVPGVMVLTPPRFGDTRGWFSEVFSSTRLAAAGLEAPFVQDNQSFSARKGTLRGLHCQVSPSIQGKLVRVLRGAIWDIAVDIRTGSPHYGRCAGATLSAENGSQLYVPGGFLHGFVTLEADTEVLYKVTAGYDRAAERGVVWDDPDLALPWPTGDIEVTLSDKDLVLPRLRDCPPWFEMDR